MGEEADPRPGCMPLAALWAKAAEAVPAGEVAGAPTPVVMAGTLTGNATFCITLLAVQPSTLPASVQVVTVLLRRGAEEGALLLQLLASPLPA
jgi:hypothetical protein